MKIRISSKFKFPKLKISQKVFCLNIFPIIFTSCICCLHCVLLGIAVETWVAFVLSGLPPSAVGVSFYFGLCICSGRAILWRGGEGIVLPPEG